MNFKKTKINLQIIGRNFGYVPFFMYLCNMLTSKQRERLNDLMSFTFMIKYEVIKDQLDSYPNAADIYRLGKLGGYSISEIEEMWESNRAHKLRWGKTNYNEMPRHVFRDNKHIHNTSGFSGGGGNYPRHRYPKKNRSKRTWSNFYKLFPDLAIADGWNGETSKRYNPKSK